jgi:hypothetical protein
VSRLLWAVACSVIVLFGDFLNFFFFEWQQSRVFGSWWVLRFALVDSGEGRRMTDNGCVGMVVVMVLVSSESTVVDRTIVIS